LKKSNRQFITNYTSVRFKIPLSPSQPNVTPVINRSFLSYSLADAGGVHLEEGVVHEEVEGLFLPGPAGVLVPTEAAQQLDAGPVARGVVTTARRNRESLHIEH